MDTAPRRCDSNLPHGHMTPLYPGSDLCSASHIHTVQSVKGTVARDFLASGKWISFSFSFSHIYSIFFYESTQWATRRIQNILFEDSKTNGEIQ
jgi:hypothetical protein